MPAATNMLKMVRGGGELPTAAAPGDAELFASLLVPGAPAGEGAVSPEETPSEGAEAIEAGDEEAVTQANTLLPILDQQRDVILAPIVFAKGASTPDAANVTAPVAVAQPQEPGGSPVSLPGEGRGLIALPAETGPRPSPGNDPGKLGEIMDPASKPESAEAKPATPAKEAATPLKAQAAADAAKATAPAAAATIAVQAATSEQVPKPRISQTATGAVRIEAKSATTAGAAVSPQIKQPEGAAPAELGEPARLPEASLSAPTQERTAPAPTLPMQASASPLQPVASAGTVTPSVGAALAEQVLDMARGSEWIERLARDISRAASADGTMRFRLAPETLGELRVEITHSERGAHVRLNVTSEAAQQALADAQPRLAAEARGQGLRIAETEISFAGGERDHSRESARQAPAPVDPRQRTVRGGAHEPAHTHAEPAGRARTDRYA